MLKYILLWFPMLVIAILNGVAREWYKKYTGELAGRQISTITLLIFFGIFIYSVIAIFPPESGQAALLIGIIWLILTLLFEFGFGLYRGNSWDQMLTEYNILKGRLWILIPVWVAIAPYVFYRML